MQLAFYMTLYNIWQLCRGWNCLFVQCAMTAFCTWLYEPSLWGLCQTLLVSFSATMKSSIVYTKIQYNWQWTSREIIISHTALLYCTIVTIEYASYTIWASKNDDCHCEHYGGARVINIFCASRICFELKGTMTK